MQWYVTNSKQESMYSLRENKQCTTDYNHNVFGIKVWATCQTRKRVKATQPITENQEEKVFATAFQSSWTRCYAACNDWGQAHNEQISVSTKRVGFAVGFWVGF